MRNLFSTMFGPGRYLNPRASGMIVFGGGGSSGPSLAEIKGAVKEYADPEFRDVFGGQDKISGNITDMNYDMNRGYADLDGAIDDVYSGMTSGFGSAERDLSNLSDDVADVSGQVSTGFNDQEDYIDDAFDGQEDFITDEFGDQQQYIGGEFTKQGEELTEGFEDTQGDIADSRTDILDRLGTNKTDLEGFLNDKFGSISTMTGGRFDSVDGLLGTLQTNQTSGFGDLTRNMTDGQSGIQSAVDGMSGNLDTYYGDLSQGQQDMSGTLGGLTSDFSTFTDQYGDDTTLANRARNDLTTGLQNAVSGIQGSLAESAASTEDQIRSAAEGNTRATEDAASQLDTNFADVARSLTMGVEASTSEGQRAQDEYLNKLNDVRSLVTNQGDQLDASVRDSYTNLANSFDTQGRLIANSVNAQGQETKRAIDKNGNLMISQFDQQGTRISQFGYDMNQMFSTLDSIQNSTISRTGMMSPATQPYASTRG